MAEIRRIGYRWNLRQMMAKQNLWKSTDLMPLLRARGVDLSESQVWRLVTGTPERIPARTFAALCDILDCSPNDLFETYVEMKAAGRVNAPRVGDDLPPAEGKPLSHRIRLVDKDG